MSAKSAVNFAAMIAAVTGISALFIASSFASVYAFGTGATDFVVLVGGFTVAAMAVFAVTS